MSEIKVNKISPRTNCGTTQLGDSGDTISIPAGVTITNSGTAAGFGSTGEVSWNTTKVTTGFTASSGVGYFADTSSGGFTITLPASPSAGNVVAIADYTGTFGTNAITVGRNSQNIQGAAADIDLNKNDAVVQLIYVDATEGWRPVFTGSPSDYAETFVSATGGTITCSGNYKIHTFTGPGTFSVSQASSNPANNIVDYLVVGGGGAGPATNGGDGISGGGGAGGFRYYANTTTNPQSGNPAAPINNFPCGTEIQVTATSYPISVGGGGPAGSAPSGWSPGVASTFSTVTAAGGGRGGRGDPTDPSAPIRGGQPGGSGGGGDNGPSDAGSGNTPPTSPAQGFNGGNGAGSSAGGGGGALAVGVAAPPNAGGDGGVGAGVTGFGTSGQPSGGKYYFSGGGGGANGNANFPSPGAAGNGGLGGGADGKNPSCTGASNATANTGGGGGGASDKNPGGGDGGAGGSGIVIIRYKYQ